MSEEKPRDGGAVAPEVAGQPFPESPNVEAAAPSTAPPPQAEDELSRLLREFDEGTRLGLPPEQREPQQPEPSAADELERILNEPAPQPVDPVTQERLDAGARQLQSANEEFLWKQADAEFDRLVSDDARELAESFPGLKQSRVRDYFEHLARREPNLTNAFFDKHKDPRRWQGLHRIALRALHKELADEQSIIEGRVMAQDRELVAASMRGAGVGKVAAEPAPAFGHMSDAELKDYTRRNFGFA
jgi:hypothetical protein